MSNIISIAVWIVFIAPAVALVVAVLDGIWCLLSGKPGLLDWIGFDGYD